MCWINCLVNTCNYTRSIDQNQLQGRLQCQNYSYIVLFIFNYDYINYRHLCKQTGYKVINYGDNECQIM